MNRSLRRSHMHHVLLGRVLGRYLAGLSTTIHNRDAAGYSHDVVHIVRDVDDRPAFLRAGATDRSRNLKWHTKVHAISKADRAAIALVLEEIKESVARFKCGGSRLEFDQLGLSVGEEQVAILVGPNGSGKSNFLKAIANEVRHCRDVVVVSNTMNDRFAGMRGFSRLSVGRGGQLPKSIIKAAVAKTIDDGSLLFYQLGATLEYCDYRPRFGFLVHPKSSHAFMEREPLKHSPEYQFALELLANYPRREMIWIDLYGSQLDFSVGREFANVLRNEDELIRRGVLSKPVKSMREESFDDQQKAFFTAVGELIKKIADRTNEAKIDCPLSSRIGQLLTKRRRDNLCDRSAQDW